MTETPDDPVARRIIAFLEAEGADEVGHAGGRTLLDHLVETYEILRRWHQPDPLAHAALIHSVYGTEAFRHAVLEPERRAELAAVAGADAERLAHLFGVTPRGPLLAGTHVWARDMPTHRNRDGQAVSAGPPATPEELDALVLIHMANLAEQARAPDGGPGVWLVRVRELAELLIDRPYLELPPFLAELTTLTVVGERDAGRLYRSALAETDDPQLRERRLAMAAVACPVVGEPCVWLAELARERGDGAAAQWWAEQARRRFDRLGVAWDKRRPLAEWIAAAARGVGRAPTSSAPDGAAGRRRFDRYVETLGEEPGQQGVYPELPSRPWFDPTQFPLARYLESNFAAIRAELLALDPARFHPESERIGRSGDWDVAFFYERGRRRSEVCDACPVTTRGIESHATMRTAAGLIYVSRMRAGTHIHPHRGPTNLRVRCHLGITVPGGDCAIRVGEETRRWQEGRCIVFDDHFEHEAFNHTGEDRIVLIVDLWHPSLSEPEVRLLEGLHRYAYAYARRLSRYWSVNDAAAVRSGGAA